MTEVLSSSERKRLDTAVQRAREIAERAAANELARLGVTEKAAPDYLDEDARALRRELRAKARQLGDSHEPGSELPLLRGEVAYEQWHRLLFARFLAVNGLLIHPEHGVPVTLAECDELAATEGEPDGWSLAASYASRILPGVFRLTDPAVEVRYAPDDRIALEQQLAAIDDETLRAQDALGWVYQFWQTAAKKAVNASGRKIGGADLAPVTQLFTEHYMVRFLLENSLGAWWAARHPDSPLVAEWDYLRRLDDGTPAAGTFEQWPDTAAEVTVMDPCCGSGHFLVAAFGMLWRMRAEEEGVSPAEAQDAVLRDNLFGLELDPRCTQIAIFNLVLEAWKQGGYRDVPVPNVACSGIPVRVPVEEWEALAGDDEPLRATLRRLHAQFRNADTLGSLIDPKRDSSGEALLSVDGHVRTEWLQTRSALMSALSRESPMHDVALESTAGDVLLAADILGGTYTLVATNVPFLSSGKQSDQLSEYLTANYPNGALDLATSLVCRCSELAPTGLAIVCPQTWRFLDSYLPFRREQLASTSFRLLASLGSRAFSTSMWDFSVGLQLSVPGGGPTSTYSALSAASIAGVDAKAEALKSILIQRVDPPSPAVDPALTVRLSHGRQGVSLGQVGRVIYGMKPGQTARVTRFYWEIPGIAAPWLKLSSSPNGERPYSGNSEIIMSPPHMQEAGITEFSATGFDAHGIPGIILSKMGRLPAAIYTGGAFDDNTYVVQPKDPGDLGAIWQFAVSGGLLAAVREVNEKIAVPTSAVERSIVDIEHWRRIANERYPDGLPEPYSDDPTQWLFKGTVDETTEPLHVAVARLLGYRWPDQEPDALDELADSDGIVTLHATSTERDAASRVRSLLERAYGPEWSTSLEHRLVAEAGGRGDLGLWLRDAFFAAHSKLFHHRPFIWHIWDGRKDGFHALVNYHRLDRQTLEKLTFTVLGNWMERQRSAVEDGTAGAELRLAAAQELQRKLQLILEGEAPYDIYVRWKSLAEQPIGWEPDLDDGVRLNIRPFVTAGVLRSKVNVRWGVDRGTNPDGSRRDNDLHPTLADRREARAAAGAAT